MSNEETNTEITNENTGTDNSSTNEVQDVVQHEEQPTPTDSVVPTLSPVDSEYNRIMSMINDLNSRIDSQIEASQMARSQIIEIYQFLKRTGFEGFPTSESDEAIDEFANNYSVAPEVYYANSALFSEKFSQINYSDLNAETFNNISNQANYLKNSYWNFSEEIRMSLATQLNELSEKVHKLSEIFSFSSFGYRMSIKDIYDYISQEFENRRLENVEQFLEKWSIYKPILKNFISTTYKYQLRFDKTVSSYNRIIQGAELDDDEIRAAWWYPEQLDSIEIFTKDFVQNHANETNKTALEMENLSEIYKSSSIEIADFISTLTEEMMMTYYFSVLAGFNLDPLMVSIDAELRFVKRIQQSVNDMIPKQGPQGLPGSSGSDGAPGIGISNAIVRDGSLILVLSNGSEVNAGKVVGPQGPKGESSGIFGSIADFFRNLFSRKG